MRADLRKNGRSRGYVGLLFAGILVIVAIAFVSKAFFGLVVSENDRIANSEKGMETARLAVLDYVRQNGVLPTVSQFQTLTSGLKDAWGQPYIYFASTSLTAGDISSVTSTPISVLQCGNDITCSAPATIQNVPFLIVSGGAKLAAGSGPIAQTTTLTSSALISSSTTFRQYGPGLLVGPYAAPTDPSRMVPYDDLVIIPQLPTVLGVSPALGKSKGDALISGGELKILNTDANLPNGVCGVAYSKTLLAYGMESGTFSWAVTGLPSGLSKGASTTKAVVISGTPIEAGTFTVAASISDPNARQASQSYTLTVTSPGWTDTGTTRTSSCSAGMVGSIAEKEQSDSCGNNQWVTTASTCVNTSTTDQRFRGSTLISAGASAFSTNTGQASLTVGSGTSGFSIAAKSSSGASANITRESTSTTSNAIGVNGGSSIYINPGESLTFTFSGGAARTFGIEFYGLGVNTTGTDKIEEAIVTLTNTLTSTVVATYTLEACVSDTTNTQRSTFFLPDPGAEFNQVKVTAGSSPSNTDFMVRSIRACGVGSSCTPSNATATTCPFP